MDEAVRILELWVPVDPSVAAQVMLLQPGDSYIFRYSNFTPGGQPVAAVLTYEQVRGVLAKVVLKGWRG